MSQPVIAQKSPIPVEVEAGKTYYWCSCGKSAKQPLCDGAHKGSEPPRVCRRPRPLREWGYGQQSIEQEVFT